VIPVRKVTTPVTPPATRRRAKTTPAAPPPAAPAPGAALLATIAGTWNPGGVPALTALTYPGAQRDATTAVQGVLGVADSLIDFYLVATRHPGGPVYRTLWRLLASSSGPTLRIGPAQTHPSQLFLWLTLRPLGEQLQMVGDLAMPDMPYRGVLAELVPALLLRHYWGPAARQITVGGLGTGTFTPQTLGWRDRFSPDVDVTVPYEQPDLAMYWFAQPPASPPPALWLVTTDAEPVGWKVSYCVERPEQPAAERWDDPAQPVPQFDPLVWPAGPDPSHPGP